MRGSRGWRWLSALSSFKSSYFAWKKQAPHNTPLYIYMYDTIDFLLNIYLADNILIITFV
jgi:hypothetical protein